MTDARIEQPSRWRLRWASFLGAVCIAADAAAGASAAISLPLRERLSRTSELGGLVVPGRPQLVTSVDLWSTSGGGETPIAQAAAADQMLSDASSGAGYGLRQTGFVHGLREGYGPRAANGIDARSSVAEFRTAAGARNEVANEVGSVHPPAPTYVAFPVVGIPGADGFVRTGPGYVAYFVMFHDGRFLYEISFAASPWAIHRRGPAIKAQTIAAAQSLYRRVHGR